MPLRQIFLDTETTGLRVEEGHRIIEIGCVEMIDRKLTGRHFHHYLNPDREIEAGALAVHGITNAFLEDKPHFHEVVQEWLNFIAGSELIIHNAPFDLSFLNYELMLTKEISKTVLDYCNIIDTLQLARRLHVGQRNSLDALCKRYGIDLSKREFHGALLDAHLLAHVYLAMTGGQGSFFDSFTPHQTTRVNETSSETVKRIEKSKLVVIKADENEQIKHRQYLADLAKQGKVLWAEE